MFVSAVRSALPDSRFPCFKDDDFSVTEDVDSWASDFCLLDCSVVDGSIFSVDKLEALLWLFS